MHEKFSRRLGVPVVLIGLGLLPGPATPAPGLQVCDSHGLVRGAEIAMEKGCFGCHTLTTKRIGPPYREIAAKYQQHNTSVAALAAKIKNGGSGVWGAVAMPPNPISNEEAEILARWIQSL